jgi:hypothetical protein
MGAMSNRDKQFSLRRLAGDATGGAVQGAAGSLAVSFLDPTGMSALVLVPTGAVCGFTAGAAGSLWGFFTDDPYFAPKFGSSALFTSTVGLLFSSILMAMLISNSTLSVSGVVIFSIGVSSFAASSLAFLIEDMKRRASDGVINRIDEIDPLERA